MLLRLLPAADYQETRRASPDTLKGDGMEQWTEGLALRMKEGDQEAFDELMEHFYPRLLPMPISSREATGTARMWYRRHLYGAG